MADKTVPPPVPKNLAKWRDEGSVKEIHGHQILVHASGPVSDDGHGVLYVHGYPGSSWSPEIPAMSQVEDITWLPHPTTRRSGREGSLPPRTRRNPCRNKGFNVYLSGGAEGIRTPDPLTASPRNPIPSDPALSPAIAETLVSIGSSSRCVPTPADACSLVSELIGAEQAPRVETSRE